MDASRASTRFVRSPSAIVGAIIVACLAFFVVAGPAMARHGPLDSDFAHGVAPDRIPVGPSRDFPLGADRLFRDELSRLAYGGRLSLLIAVAATAIASAIGATVGVVSGYLEGQRARVPWPVLLAAGAFLAAVFAHRLAAVLLLAVCLLPFVRRIPSPRLDIDGLLMRLVDLILAFPFLLLVMFLGAAREGTSAFTIFVTLGLTGWVGIARVVRGKTMQVRTFEYVVASRALGQSAVGVIAKHVLPNVLDTVLVSSTLLVAQMIVADSVLSYLGMGIAPPTPTWGRMLYEGQDYYVAAPWLVAAPGTTILLAVWGFNMLGEGLRNALDPHSA